MPPLRNNGEHCKMMVGGSIRSRTDDPDTINDGDVYFIFDAKRHGNESALMKGFAKADGRTMKKEKLMLFITSDEESLKKRRVQVRGHNAIRQCEFLHVVSAGAVITTEKQRRHYSGSNHGDVIGPVVFPDLNNGWQMAFAVKKKLYGPARIAVGGTTEGEASPTLLLRPASYALQVPSSQMMHHGKLLISIVVEALLVQMSSSLQAA